MVHVFLVIIAQHLQNIQCKCHRELSHQIVALLFHPFAYQVHSHLAQARFCVVHVQRVFRVSAMELLSQEFVDLALTDQRQTLFLVNSVQNELFRMKVV